MNVSRRFRTACVIAGVFALMAATGGITYAATTATSKPASTYAVACTTPTAALRLISHGKCPGGDAQIKLAAAPTPIAVNGANATQKAKVGNFTFTATCRNDMGGQHAELDISSNSGYVVQGGDVLVNNNSGVFSTPSGGAANGAGQISFAASEPDLTSPLRLDDPAGVTGTLVIIQSGHTLTLTFALFAYDVDCSVQGQVAPSS